MNNKITLKTISLKDLWNVLRGCFLFVIGAVIVFTVGMYAYAKVNYTPKYSSTGTIYLVDYSRYSSEDGDKLNNNQWTVEYTLANVIASDTMYVLKSRTVLNAVGEDVGIKNGYGALKNAITIENPEDTRVLEITATADSPEKAKAIVDSLCKHGPAEAKNVLLYDSIRPYEEGTLNTWPINQVTLLGYLKFGIIAGALVYLFFLAMFLFDNYIHTEEDIERYLGVSIIGDIPDADAPKKKNKYANYRYKKKGEKQYYSAHSGGYKTYGYASRAEAQKPENSENVKKEDAE